MQGGSQKACVCSPTVPAPTRAKPSPTASIYPLLRTWPETRELSREIQVHQPARSGLTPDLKWCPFPETTFISRGLCGEWCWAEGSLPAFLSLSCLRVQLPLEEKMHDGRGLSRGLQPNLQGLGF